MARVCVLFADGFEEIEAVTIVDVLRRADIEVTTVAVTTGPVPGSHGMRIETDTALDGALDETWDMVILPGGMPGSSNLRDDPRVRELLRRQNEDGRQIAAICAAPIALGAAGLLRGRRATSYPAFADQLEGAEYVEDRVVRDGNIVTSRGPGTALEFALQLVHDLASPEAAARLREGMLVQR